MKSYAGRVHRTDSGLPEVAVGQIWRRHRDGIAVRIERPDDDRTDYWKWRNDARQYHVGWTSGAGLRRAFTLVDPVLPVDDEAYLAALDALTYLEESGNRVFKFADPRIVLGEDDYLAQGVATVAAVIRHRAEPATRDEATAAATIDDVIEAIGVWASRPVTTADALQSEDRSLAEHLLGAFTVSKETAR